MHITSVTVKNFRLLKETKLTLDFKKKQEFALLIGKNNSGKTSFIVLFDKFFKNDSAVFNFNDFSVCLRKKIRGIDSDSDLSSCSIQMKLEIAYSKEDNLAVLSDFILDLNPDENVVRILFEATINSDRLLADLNDIKEGHVIKFIEKNLEAYVDSRIYVYAQESDLSDSRNKIVEKKIDDVKRLINYQVIHAKRNVSSSEFHGSRKTALSDLASSYFNKANLFSINSFGEINDKILEVDDQLNKIYEVHFKDYLSTAKEFVKGGNLNVVSNLESKQILENYSKIVYGEGVDTYLPETLNGLGHLNILFLLLKIEVKKRLFEQEKRDINLFFIEEPEAHTHPQMQYIFAQRIKKLLKSIPNLQTLITSHSSHIVSQCDFEDLRYFKLDNNENIQIENFHQDLAAKYESEKDHFKFLKQFLTLYASELFFAEKIIFIEGTSEKLLLPHFIKCYDESRKDEDGFIPLTSQNISFVEAGANARVFRHFIDFLGIKTLIFTDLDSCKIEQIGQEKSYWKGCMVDDSTNTTNVTIKYYYGAPLLPEKKERELKVSETKFFDDWYAELIKKSLNSISPNVLAAYQTKENSYHARSFEDAFLSVNLALVNTHKENINGLKNRSKIKPDRIDFYELTEEILKPDGKSDFASSLLYLALTEDIKWTTPNYIVEGLNWISK
jgi:putative ATP-dependent endonuclease of OLD family